ncbi:hypothetical protein GWK47_017282 [Chionoecetes opilio]|uniref:Uncharacterized protein n=1 Tax=Chionoecetes opilio TaxID=41210 RepID=A0A8J4XTX1_CHIOP|nr:hypothetical protein GWK47_017282 [Chionoecetes opilio]
MLLQIIREVKLLLLLLSICWMPFLLSRRKASSTGKARRSFFAVSVQRAIRAPNPASLSSRPIRRPHGLWRVHYLVQGAEKKCLPSTPASSETPGFCSFRGDDLLWFPSSRGRSSTSVCISKTLARHFPARGQRNLSVVEEGLVWAAHFCAIRSRAGGFLARLG